MTFRNWPKERTSEVKPGKYTISCLGGEVVILGSLARFKGVLVKLLASIREVVAAWCVFGSWRRKDVVKERDLSIGGWV